MPEDNAIAPESSAVRVALWRALHVLADAPPPVLADEVGLQLVGPELDWRERPDMDPQGTSGFRASIVSRARFIEDLIVEQAEAGVGQYVLLGAGLDTFAQRRPEVASRLTVFEIDQPGPQAWKRRRLVELGYGVPEWLRLVPVNFEVTPGWWEQLAEAGFDASRPAVVTSTGVSMYISKEATAETLRQVATFAPGSTLAMSFLLQPELVAQQDRPGLEMSSRGARSSGTPFVSFYTPEELLGMARDAGFKGAQHVSGSTLADRYFSDRTDGLRPSTGEDLLVATT